MESDFSWLLLSWVFGWSCGALSWYWVLKFYNGNSRDSKSDEERKQPSPLSEIETNQSM